MIRGPLGLLLLLSLAACTQAPVPAPDSQPKIVENGPAVPIFESLDHGQQHPPLPADEPTWDWDAGGDVGDHGWYGEHSWHDVRMRVVGHLALIAVERGRVAIAQGDRVAAQQRYQELAADLAAVPAPPPGPAQVLRDRMALLATQEQALLAALAEGEAPPATGEGLWASRARYLSLAEAPTPDPAALRALQAQLLSELEPRPDLDLDAFADFKDRHALRGRLWSAWAEGLDPIADPGDWGYWEGASLARSALALGVAAGWLGGEDWTPRLPEGARQRPTGPPAAWPAQVARALGRIQDPARFDADELGWLPTGDSLIDVGAGPGPRAIGKLERLGLDDPAHRARLEALSILLNGALADNPEEVLPLVQAYIADMDALGHGSRYYNIKQARNAAIRQLAKLGRPDLALDLLRQSWPLHNQDWACPNREAILRTLEGRLLAQAGDLVAAEEVLAGARAESLRFLAFTEAAEAAPPGQEPGARPPWRQGGGPPHRPNENRATSPHRSTGAPKLPSNQAAPAGSAPGSAKTQR